MLPPSPWNLDALIRLCASILLGILCVAGLGQPLVYFLQEPQHPNALRFLAWGLAGLISFGAALWMLGRPLPRDGTIRPLILLMVAVYGGFLFAWLASGSVADLPEGSRLNSGAGMVISVLGFQGMTLLLVWRSLREMQVGWNGGFGLRERLVPSLLAGAAAACLFMPIGWILIWGSGELMQQVRLEPVEQEAIQVLRTAGTPVAQIVLGIAAVLLAPLSEEVLFRGILYPFIKQRGYPRLALWGTSIMFALIHANLLTFLPLMLLAIMLVALYEATGNLLAPIAAHMVFNGVNYAALLYGVG